jgi:acyl carrier protein
MICSLFKSSRRKVLEFTGGRVTLSDEDFLRECGLAARDDRGEVALAVRRVVAKLGKIDSLMIRPSDRWPDELGMLPFWDSIDFLHFVLSVEDELKCRIVGGSRDLIAEDEPITVAYLARRIFEMRSGDGGVVPRAGH